MPTTDQLQFEMQRRVILFNSGTTMPDNTVLGYEGNPNYASTATPGQTLLYNSPRGTSYIELVNGNLWYKQQIPNTWINLTSGTQSGTANFSSQNNVVYTTGNQDISGVKNFYSRPTVNGSGVLLIGETGSVVLPNTLVYTTGDQTINGLKDFTTRPTVNTIPVLLSGEVNTTISGVLYSAQINIKNNNGSTIYKGQPVYVSSAAGTNILVKLASNSGEQTSSKTLGLVYQTSLAQNAQGTIVTEGLLQGFNTNAGEEGDPIWLGPNGSLIFGLANKPYAPNHLVYLGVLTRKHANQGEVFVKIQNGFELEELHNVNINHTNALADKNIIRYNSLSGIWFNDTINSVLPNSIVYITGNQTISGNKTFDVAPILSGNKLITGVDLSSYATVSNLFSTGSILDNKINSLSGYVNSQDIVFSGQIASTGSNLYNSILSLSGLFTGYTGSLDANFATDAQLFTTGSVLDNKINALSGYVSGISLGGLLPSTIVYTTGNQLISGNKTFLNNIAVSGTGNFNNVRVSSIDKLFLSGIDMVVTGNSSINVYNNIYISGNQVLTGVDLSSYATNINLYTTGSILDNKINSLSGYVNSQSNSGQVFNTGSLLDNKINALSGYVNSQDIIFSGQTASTGSILDNKINSLSGYVNSQDIILSGQVASSGSRLDDKINALSGYVSGISAGGTLPSTIVYITGNQTISGTKTFANNLEVQGTGIFNALDLSNISEFNFSGTNINLINGNVNISGGTLYISGNAVLTGVNLNAYATTANLYATGSTLDNKINSLSGYVNSQDVIFSGQTFNTGSRLDNKINSLSGYLNSQDIILSGQTASTGSILNNKINALSGYVSGISLGGSLLNSIVYITGNQTISGNKNFAQNVTVGDETQDNLLIVSGNAISFGVYPTINGTGIVYTQGNQTISGIKTFNVLPIVSGNTLITGINTGSFASTSNLFATGSILDNKINSLSGYVNYQDTIFSGQTFNTGSRLDGKINSLSGYVNSQDLIFSGQIASTGSNLYNSILSLSGLFTGYTGNLDANFASDAQLFATGSILNNKINSLSGYINSPASNIVFTTGDQIISGDKNFVKNVIVGDQAQDNLLIVSGNTISFGVYPTVNGTGIVYNQGNQTISGVKTFDVAPILSGNRLITGVDLGSYATTVNLYATGSTLDNKINALSGYVSGISAGGSLPNSIVYITGDQIISGIKTFASRPNVNGTGVLLSGEASSVTLPPTIVYTTGDQIISGNKTFINNIAVSGTGNFNNVKVSNIDKLFLSGIDIVVTGNSSVNIYNAIYISGNAVLTGVIPTPQAITNVVYTTGDQIISGNKTFLNNINVSGTGNFNNVKVSSIDNLFLSGIDILITGNSSINVYNAIYISGNPVLTGVIPTAQTITNVVYTTGNQTISGVKTFANTGSFDTLQITNKKLSSYNYVNSNFIFGNTYINIANSSNNIIGTLPSAITSGINYYVKNLNTGILLITGSGQRTIDGFSNINLYKNESLQLLGVNNLGYTGWVTLSADNGVS